MKLLKKNTQTEICSRLHKAESFMAKAIGLIGKTNFDGQGLLFENERWPHTFFMSMPIDILYVDKEMKVVKINHSLPPWRMVLPTLKAWAIIELAAGVAQAKQINVGDELYVGH